MKTIWSVQGYHVVVGASKNRFTFSPSNSLQLVPETQRDRRNTARVIRFSDDTFAIALGKSRAERGLGIPPPNKPEPLAYEFLAYVDGKLTTKTTLDKSCYLDIDEGPPGFAVKFAQQNVSLGVDEKTRALAAVSATLQGTVAT